MVDKEEEEGARVRGNVEEDRAFEDTRLRGHYGQFDSLE